MRGYFGIGVQGISKEQNVGTIARTAHSFGANFFFTIDLPSFRHPTRAAYVLGPEMGGLSPELVEKCDHIIKIPMKFCVNVGVAGALVMYDRLLSMGRFADRPVKAGGPTEMLPEQPLVHRRKQRRKKS